MSGRGRELPRPTAWVVYARDRKASVGWRNLLNECPENLDRAWVAITADPRGFSDRQERLKGDPASTVVEGVTLEQWQYEVTAGGRIWYAIDDDRRTLWITRAGTGHPKETDTRGRPPLTAYANRASPIE